MAAGNGRGPAAAAAPHPPPDHDDPSARPPLKPSTSARIRHNLLDVDSIRGATAFNTEPAKFSSVLWQSALKVLFFPLAFHWMRRRRRLPHATFYVGSFFYVAQGLTSLVVLCGWPRWLCERLHFEASLTPDAARTLKDIVSIPVVVWFFCALAYGHLCAVSQSDGGKKKRRVPARSPLYDHMILGAEHKEAQDEDEDKAPEAEQPSPRRESFSTQPPPTNDEDEDEDEEDEDEELEEVLDDDEDAYHREEPFSEELQEQEEKVLLNTSSSRGLLQPLPSPKPPTADAAAAAAPAAERHMSPTPAAAASVDDEEMWGLGADALDGGASVRVTLFNSHGEGFKVPMTLSQLRRRLVERAVTSQQDWTYRTGLPMAGAVLAALVPVLHQAWVTWGEREWAELSALVEDWTVLHAQLLGTREAMVCTAIRLLSMATVFFLASAIFRQLAVAELTFKRRYKYSKLFSMITSLSKAQRYAIPHFTLKNPLNIKMWMALRAGRAWLRRYEAQRLADTVVSSTFRNVVLLLTILCIEVFLGKDKRPFLTQLWHWELLVWGGVSSVFLLRYFSLGSRINEKYNDPGVLLTESINIQLRIFENSCRTNDQAKREKLQISANVLKLAVKLLKELDSPTLINGLSMSPTLVRVTRVILVSALSAVVSDQFGFKLRLKFLK